MLVTQSLGEASDFLDSSTCCYICTKCLAWRFYLAWFVFQFPLQALELAWVSHLRLTKGLQIGAKHEGRGQEMAARESDASRVQRVIIYVPKMSLAGPVSGTTDQSTESCFMLREWDSSNKTCTHGWNF